MKYDLYDDGGGAIVGFEIYCHQCGEAYPGGSKPKACTCGTNYRLGAKGALKGGLFGGKEELQAWLTDWLSYFNPEVDTLRLVLLTEDLWHELELGLEVAILSPPRAF